MAGTRRATPNRSPLFRLSVVAGVLLLLVLAGIRLLPGSPLAHSAAATWGRSQSPRTGGAPPTSAQKPSRSGRPTPTPTPTLPALPVGPADVKINATGWWSWALLDTRTGEMSGSANRDETNTTASLIKAWIVADYLRRTAEAGNTPSDAKLADATKIIRDSDNTRAQQFYESIGGVASIKRLLSICDLTDSKPAADGGWSRTKLSPQDTTRMGACIADKRAAGPKWTEWLLNEMRQVRGVGDFGIRKAFSTEERKQIAIKNGWVDRTAEQEYHVNCLAIGDGWAMAVMARYPINLDYSYGAKICQNVARQLRTD